ncbi:MAG: hypothetical protein KJO83_07335 [Bacteroidia bacterium]|nr:hypothetical protein [Bacteroidia bacterium]
MKIKIATIILFVLSPICLMAQDNSNKSSEKNPIIGNWKIDLRPTPESDGYFQSFVVELIEEKTFKGTFYGSDLENALLNSNWDKLYFAFSTRDQNNEYYHSGYLHNGKLFGITYCPNRSFAAPWTGVKK